MTVELSPEIEAALDGLTAMGLGTREEIILDGVREHISDLQAGMIAKQRLDDVRSGKSRTYSLAEVMDLHGVER